jgi:hypothetical protein
MTGLCRLFLSYLFRYKNVENPFGLCCHLAAETGSSSSQIERRSNFGGNFWLFKLKEVEKH